MPMSGAVDVVRGPVRRREDEKTRRFLPRGWDTRHWERVWICCILLVAGLAHGVNMFGFPYYEADEGTYMAQAWAVVNQGAIAPYTYFYDHAPVGWLQISGWTLLTGGFETFGTVVESGRVLMLVFQVATTLLLYKTARNLSGSVAIATLVALIFALSAYGILYHRRVLLDNIATFWIMLSIFLLSSRRPSLNKIWLSAFAIGVAVLSKEVAVFIVPILAVCVLLHAHRSQRWFAVVGWVSIVGSIVSTYLLLAVLKNELFPTGWLPGDDVPHVSLIETLQWQASRGRDGGFFNPESKFWSLTEVWMYDDPLLVVGGTLCAVVSVLTIFRRPFVGLLLGLATFAFWAFLGRGGEILPFYLLPLLPILALNVGMTVNIIARGARVALGKLGGETGRKVGLSALPVMACLCLPLFLAGYQSTTLGFEIEAQARVAERAKYKLGLTPWRSEQSTAQKQAIDWVRANIEPGSTIIIDNYMWTDLHEQREGRPHYDLAHWYWKVEQDLEIKDGVLEGDWRNVDYVVSTRQMISDTEVEHLGLVDKALQRSDSLARFNTGGWPIEVLKVDKSEE